MKKSFKLAAVLLFCFLLVFVLACNPFEAGGEEEITQRLVTVERGDLVVSVSGSGTFKAADEAKLYFSTGGKVEKVYVEEGDEVFKGDMLAKLDTSALELALLQARAARDEAEYNLSQLKNVLRASSDRVKIAELQLEAAEKAVAQAQKQLDEAILRAPFSGVVVAVTVDEGDIVPNPAMAPQPIIQLIDPNSIELEVEVDEIDIARVKPGQEVVIDVDALPDLELEGEVVEIHPLPFPQGGVVFYKVTIRLKTFPMPGLRVGMSATADIIITKHEDVLIIPERAVQKDEEGNPVVKVMVGEEPEVRKVVLGISDGFNVEVVDGLKEGDIVVVEVRSKAEPGGFFFGG